jgi:dephospho-CoA kinase
MKANLVTFEDAKNLVLNSRIVLDKAIKLGGSTIKSYHSGNGVDGKFQNELLMYGKEDTPCVECGTTIVKTFVGGRGTCFCPNCQMHLANKKVRVIGITGLIGAGKSSVSNILKEYDVEIIDADKISRSSLDVGTLAYQKTIKAFGEIILNEDKTINRSILREITSSDKEQMKILESIIHPYVKEETIRRINESKARYVVLDVPLLFESNMDKLCDLTIFIHCKDDVRLERLVKRATMPLKDAKKLNSQVMSMKDKIALADVVVDNSKDLDFTRNQIEKIMTKI